MNFSGKYQVQSQENFEPFMKAMGECWTKPQSWYNGNEGLSLLSADSQGLMLRWEEGSRVYQIEELSSDSPGLLVLVLFPTEQG